MTTYLVPMWLTLTAAILFGLSIGSFLNVVIWRLPRGGSVSTPTWSYCPRCEHRLGTLDLFPVLSFLLLGRKCRYCHAPISWRYPSIELLTGLLFTAVAWKFGWQWDTVFTCLFVAIMICVFFIDLEHFIIPDGLNLIGILLGFAHNAFAITQRQPHQWGPLFGLMMPQSIKGLILYAGVIYGIGLLSYVVLVSFMGKKKNVFRATWQYVSENVGDWVYLTIYYLGTLIPPLRRFVEPPIPLEGTTAQEIEDDEEAGGMGGGDGKLAAAIGAFLYWQLALQSAVFALVIGALTGIVVLIRERRTLGSRTPIPFGPAMVCGALVALFFGSDIVNWYITTFWTFPHSPFVPDTAGSGIVP